MAMIPGASPQENYEIAVARRQEAEHSQQIIDIQLEVEQQARRRREEREQERREYLHFNGPHMPPKLNNSSIFKTEQAIRQAGRLPQPSAPPGSPPDLSDFRWNGHLETGHSQQIINIRRELEHQAHRRGEECAYANASHMPARLINSSTIHDEAEYRQQITDHQREYRQPDGPSIYTINTSSVIGASNSSVNYPHAPPVTPDYGLRHLRFPKRVISKDDELPSYDEAIALDSATTVNTTRY